VATEINQEDPPKQSISRRWIEAMESTGGGHA
jgi:hypothetical protein